MIEAPFAKQLKRQFARQREMAKGKSRDHVVSLYPFSLEEIRAIMDVPENIKNDADAIIAWVRKNKDRRVAMYLEYYYTPIWTGVG